MTYNKKMTAKQMEWAMRRKERGLERGVQRGLQRMLVLNKPLADEWKAFLREKNPKAGMFKTCQHSVGQAS